MSFGDLTPNAYRTRGIVRLAGACLFLNALVSDYLAAGGEVKRIPFGMSGYRAQAKVLVAGRRGWIMRHGMIAVPAYARDVVAAGLITIAEARVDLVYCALLEKRERPPTLTDLGRALGFYPRQVRAVVDVLERDGFVQRDARSLRVIARPQRPTWSNYVRAA